MKARPLLLVSLIVISLFAFAGCEKDPGNPVLSLDKQGQDFLDNWNNAVRQQNIKKLANMITEPFVIVDENGTETVYAKADSFVEEFQKEVKHWGYENYALRPSQTTIVNDRLQIKANLYYVRKDPDKLTPTGLSVTYTTNKTVELTFEKGEKNIVLSRMKSLAQ